MSTSTLARVVVAAGPALVACLASGCASNPPAVGMFGDGPEVYYGRAAPAYDADTGLFVGAARFSMRGSTSGQVCEGRTSITHVPPDNRCRGQRGAVSAQCGPDRMLEATWSASSCRVGHGEGRDSDGIPFAFTFGVPEGKAVADLRRRLGRHRTPPDWPPADHAK